jgi:hypothetical protein
MSWVVGIDEAGYGPNLGPFVMTAVALRVPDDPGGDLWQRLAAAVRRDTDPDDGRLLVADSKVVYSPARGLGPLETAVLAAHRPAPDGGLLLRRYVEALYPSSHPDLRRECWYTGATLLPVETEAGQSEAARERFAGACREAGVVCGLIRGVVVCPGRFNALTDAAGSKGAVLRHGLAELVRACWALAGNEPLAFFIDKHGGRNTYAAMLQDAVPEGFVLAHHESMARSVYSMAGLGHEVRWTFQPRADAEHFSVALASMVSKYVREVLMGEFNRFWQERVPGLRPTAGYPGDSKRYYDAIRPAAERLGIPEAALWRRK